MIRYLILLVLFFVAAVFTLLFTGGTVLGLLYPHSFAIVAVIPFLYVSILFGFKEMGMAFSMPLKKETDKNKIRNGIDFFKTFGRTIWLATLVTIVFGALTTMGFLDAGNAVGSNKMFALLSVLYAAIIHIVVIIPFTVFLEKLLKE